MHRHTRAVVAASAYAIVSGRKAAGMYEHETGHHIRIAAEARDGRLQGLDGERSAAFGGTLPNLFDAGDAAWFSCAADGTTVRGYDHGSAGYYETRVEGALVSLYDHGAGAWFAFTVNGVDAGDGPGAGAGTS